MFLAPYFLQLHTFYKLFLKYQTSEEWDHKFRFRYYKNVLPLMSGFSKKTLLYFLIFLSSFQEDLDFFLIMVCKHRQQRRPMLGLGCSTKKWKAI
jgi:hypothetical protein